MSSSSTHPAADLRPHAVARAVAAQVWPLLALAAVFQAAALLWMARSGDRVPAAMAWTLLTKPGVLGLVASFALHESAHVLVLRRTSTVTHITVERTAWRTSVIPHGTLTPRATALVALAGPTACAALGALLWLSALDRALAWWYLAHLVFLLPCFGDGRALWRAAREARNRRTPATP
ncbi:metalloprotease family protein [Streptomyces sp. CC208A]|uniref:metalloprotease family protein n=1 Tax=Streptomyces sp. CC208A TaxID=3044573 RepID=UPI0024A7C70E|nr:metalloprotease family protein [Streptomyces sp. CC208A]